jgi:ABC-type lipoprotein release transport system permease subunit
VPVAEAYASFEQTPLQTYSFVVDSKSSIADTSRLLRESLNEIDRGQPFTPLVPMSEYVQRNLAGSHLQAECLLLFATVSLVAAAIGLYGLLTYLVAGARREWAIRLALGASAFDLGAAVLYQSVAYAVLGVSSGLGLFLVASTLLKTLIYGITMWNPLLVTACGGIIATVCVLAAILPAMSAVRISPAESLLE